MSKHDLVKTGDADAFGAICDQNGEVVLAWCRRCRKGEVELGPTCDACATPAEFAAAVAAARRDGIEAAAAWHEGEAATSDTIVQMRVSPEDARVWQDCADYHRDCAAAIRALLERVA